MARHYTKPPTRMLVTWNRTYDYWTIVIFVNRSQTYVRRAIHFWFVAERVAEFKDGPVYWRTVQ